MYWNSNEANATADCELTDANSRKSPAVWTMRQDSSLQRWRALPPIILKEPQYSGFGHMIGTCQK